MSSSKINPIIEKITQLVDQYEVLTQRDLELFLISEFDWIEKNKLLEAISSAAQDSAVKRVEYILFPNQYRYLYFPITARIL